MAVTGTSTCFMWCKNGLQSFGSILCLFSHEDSQDFRNGGLMVFGFKLQIRF